MRYSSGSSWSFSAWSVVNSPTTRSQQVEERRSEDSVDSTNETQSKKMVSYGSRRGRWKSCRRTFGNHECMALGQRTDVKEGEPEDKGEFRTQVWRLVQPTYENSVSMSL